jgi:hypothetical protein
MSSTPNTSNKAKLTSKVVALLGYFVTWFVMFPIFVVGGILTILVDRVFPSKDDANTRLTISDESKIPPKKTSKDSVPVFKSESRNEYGVPIELVEQKRKAKV